MSLITGAAEIVGGGMVAIGGSIFGVAPAPLVLVPVVASASVIATEHGSTAIVSAANNLGNGHGWDPNLDYYKKGLKEIQDDWIEV